MKIKAQEISDMYSEYGGKVLGRISKKVRNHNDAEDVAMEVWVGFLKFCGTGRVKSKKALSTILYRITDRCIVNFYRRQTNDNRAIEAAKTEVINEHQA